MRFTVAKNETGSISFDEHTNRFTLANEKGLILSSIIYKECQDRAKDKGLALVPVKFGGWKSFDGKPISVEPKESGWEMDVGGAAHKFADLSSCIAAAQEKQSPPQKRQLLQKKC